MTTPRMSNCVSRLFFCALASILMLSMGCPEGCGGFNPSAMPLDASQMKDYGGEVKAHKTPIETIVFGQLGPGSTEGALTTLSVLFDALVHDINQMKQLDPASGGLASWGDSLIQDIKTTIATQLTDAAKSANGAKNLVMAVIPYVKIAGSLASSIADGERHVPDSAKTTYQTLSDKLTKDFEGLYQAAVARAQGHMQYLARVELDKIETVLTHLQHNLATAAIIVTPALRDQAFKALTDTMNKRSLVMDFVGQMSSANKVHGAFANATVDLAASLAQLKIDYQNHVVLAFKPEADTLYNDADSAQKALAALAVDYQSIDDLKRPVPADAHLSSLIDKAFAGGASVALGMASIDQETDINKLAGLLSKHSMVVMTSDNSSLPLVEALASSVVYKVAPLFGLSGIDNVVGPDHRVLNKTKEDLSMTDNQFADFLTSRAKLIRAESSKGTAYKNIYVVFADQYGSTNVLGMIEEFSKDNGKVLVVAADKSAYMTKDAQTFSHGFLTVSEGAICAQAIIKERNPDVSSTLISETLVKIYAAFGDLTLGNLRPAVIATLERLPKTPVPRRDDINNAVMAALALLKVPTYLVKPSGILSDTDLNVVQRNLNTSRNFYVDAARYGDTTARTKENALRDAATRALDARIADADIVRKAAQDIALIEASLDITKQRAREKQTMMNTSLKGMKVALDARRSALENSFNGLMVDLEKCRFDAAEPNFDIKFPAVAFRQALIQQTFDPALAPHLPQGRAIRGNPNLAAQPDLSWASCLIEGAKVNQSKVLIQQESADAQNKVKRLFTDFKVCVGKALFDGPVGIKQCSEDAVKNFDDSRKDVVYQAGPGQESNLTKILRAIGTLSYDNTAGLFVPLITTLQPLWRYGAGGVNAVVLSGVATSYGDNIKLSLNIPGLPANAQGLAHANRFLNRHYYLKKMVDIIGTGEGKNVQIDLGAVVPVNVATLTGLAMPANNQFAFIKPLLGQFTDDDAVMVKARREAEKHYPEVVASFITQLINGEVVQPLVDQVIRPFFSLPLAELKKFQEDGGALESIARRAVWNDMKSFANRINDLAAALARDFIAQSPNPGITEAARAPDALFAVGGSGLEDVKVQFDGLVLDMIALDAKLVGGPGQALTGLDATLVGKITTLKATLNALQVKITAGGSVKTSFDAAYWDAYDVHKFNYFNMQNQARIIAPPAALGIAPGLPRTYPVGHPRAAVVHPQTGNNVRHPLEP